MEILKYTKKSDVEKIPKEKIIMWETNMDNQWDFKIDKTKKIEEQNILDETRAIIANIFYDYWATDYQRQRIDEKDKRDYEILEGEKYCGDNLFKDRITKDDIEQENITLPVIKEEKRHKSIFRILTGWLKKDFKS